MPLNRDTAVIGSAIRVPITDDTHSLEELLYEVTQAALADAGLTIEAIDGIVVGSNDQFDGRAISIMAASGSVGGVDRDILSTPSAGEHAFVMGVLRVASGQYETHLVLSWSPTEADSLSEVQRLGADPYYHRHLPMTELTAAALQAGALAGSDPTLTIKALELARHNRARGASAYGANDIGGLVPPWPISPEMISAPTTGVVAMVLASEDYVRQHKLTKVAWVQGMGWATDADFMGDRDLLRSPALEAAKDRAFDEAGLTDLTSGVDVIELSGTTPYQELLAAHTLGLDLSADRLNDTVNPSGGVTSQNPVFCTGMMRIAEIANQVRGTAGRHQVSKARRGVAHAASGFAGMYQAVLVLGDQQNGDVA